MIGAMEWIGELERAFATSLYPLRVPIAIGLVIAAVAFVLIARRRGWFAAARRHPARSAALAAVLLVVGGPIAWYLGSPLFIRTSLDEPAPVVGAGPTIGPEASPMAPEPGSDEPGLSDGPGAAPTLAPTAPPPSLAAERAGEFQGADDFHFGSGRARLIETAPGEWVVRFEDFSVRNGPDLFVYLSPDPDGYAKGAIELDRLKATDGSFNTKVPAGSDVTEMRSVVIWCKQFAVQFAVAELR
jgi:hypothetical protein